MKQFKDVIEKIKDIPNLKMGWVICDPNIMTVDSEILEYEDAKRLIKNHTARIGWMPNELMPVFWISEEEDDEFSPSSSLEAE